MKTHLITVDYSLSFKEILEQGKHDAVNDRIRAANFPTMYKGKVIENKVELIHFSTPIGQEEALKKLSSCPHGCGLATVYHLMALAVKYPDLQRELQIVAFGSILTIRSGQQYVPYLGGTTDFRHLGIWEYPTVWESNWRFARVYDQSAYRYDNL